VREVVALHKERYVFPLRLVVTKVSGAGQDSLFMGVLRVSGGGASCCRGCPGPATSSTGSA
jgi:hypothetical protein